MRYLENMGTLGNGALQVRWSTLCNGDSVRTLGLFAARDYQHGDVVTSYGGIRRDLDEVRAQKPGLGTHVRLIPGNLHYCMDGGPWSKLFDRSDLSWQSNQVNLRQDCAIELKDEILRSGVGYMANTGPRGQLNVKVESVLPNELDDPVMFFVATKYIKCGEEIFSPYNNNESRNSLGSVP